MAEALKNNHLAVRPRYKINLIGFKIQELTAKTEPSYKILREKIRAYSPHAYSPLLNNAFLLMISFHRNQAFPDGELFIFHQIRVAILLADWKMDMPTVVAGLVHNVPIKLIERRLGKEVADLVQRKHDLEQLTYKPKDGMDQKMRCFNAKVQKEKNLKVHLLVAADIFQTLSASSKKEGYLARREYVEKAIDITAPFLELLGYGDVARKLEDHAFMQLKPEEYKKHKELLDKMTPDIKDLKKIHDEIFAALSSAGIPTAFVFRPSKNVARAYEKAEIRKLNVLDASGIRYIVDTIDNCYATAGIVRNIMEKDGWEEIKEDFDDRIVNPKPNQYQSLHLTFKKGEKCIEIQVRSEKMDRVAEFGTAAHWRYKHSDFSDIEMEDGPAASRFQAMREALVLADKFYFRDQTGIFHEVITNPGKLPTPLDLAFAAGEELGLHLIEAHILVGGEWHDLVLGKSIPLRTINAIPTIKFAANPEFLPTKDNLPFAHSPLAYILTKLWVESAKNHGIDKTAREYMGRGRQILDGKLTDLNALLTDQLNSVLLKMGIKDTNSDVLYSLNDVAKKMGLRSIKELYIKIGISDDPEAEGHNIRTEIKRSSIALAHNESEIRKNRATIFLLYPDKPNLFLKLAECLKENNINLLSLHVEPRPGDTNEDPLVFQTWEIAFGNEASFKNLIESLRHAHSNLKPGARKFKHILATVQMLIKEDRINDIGLTAKIAERISRVGGHVYSGDIGPFTLSFLNIRIPLRKRAEILNKLTEELKGIEEIATFHLQEGQPLVGSIPL